MTSTEMTLAEQKDLALVLAKSNLLPPSYQQNPANVLVAIEYAKALNIAPMHAINSINVIKGKPTLSAGLMSALVRKHGCKLRVKVEGQGQNAVAHAKLIRPDDDFEFVCTWDMERAKRAGVAGGTNWQKYPEAMLKARVISEVCREGAEDFLQGFSYTTEELGGEVVPSAVASVTVEPSDPPSVPLPYYGEPPEAEPIPVATTPPVTATMPYVTPETGEVIGGEPTADTPEEAEVVDYSPTLDVT